MFSWFNARDAKRAGEAMARSFMEQVPQNMALTEKTFAKRSRQALERVSQQAAAFKHAEKLNTYKIAQAGNTFKWTLLDAGYDRAYVDELTEWFVSRLR